MSNSRNYFFLKRFRQALLKYFYNKKVKNIFDHIKNEMPCELSFTAIVQNFVHIHTKREQNTQTTEIKGITGYRKRNYFKKKQVQKLINKS